MKGIIMMSTLELIGCIFISALPLFLSAFVIPWIFEINNTKGEVFMRCDVKNCLSNEDGYCMDSSYVSIDENGECSQIEIIESEDE